MGWREGQTGRQKIACMAFHKPLREKEPETYGVGLVSIGV